MDWRLLQLADSAFPVGGFAHSSGLEAALQQGEVESVEDFKRFLFEALWQTGYGAMPLATAAHESGFSALASLDSLCDAFLSGHVANRASRVQGRAFLSTCGRSIGGEAVARLGEQSRAQGLKQHFSPLFGATLDALGVDREAMQRLLLFGALRGIVSSAVRLGLFGPYQAQSIQWRVSPRLEEVFEGCRHLGVDELAQTAPWLEICQSNHDRLYSRLFQS